MDDFDISGGDSSWFGGDGLDLTSDTSTGSSDGSDIWGDSGVFGGSSSSSSSPQMGDTPAPGWDSGSSSSGTDGTDSGSSVWGSALSGAAAGSAFGPWGTVIGAGLGLVSGFFKGKSQESQLKEKEKLDEKELAYKMQLQEQYYQAHGQQLAGAYQGYKQFATQPGAPTATSQIGLAAPTGGPSGYFQ